jgi:hypothetical protein
MAVAVELVEPGVGISLQYATEACKMGLRVDTFSVRAVSEYTRGPALTGVAASQRIR